MRNCFNCNKPTKNPKYCSSSCAASVTNKNRSPRSIESRKKTADSVGKYHKEKPQPFNFPRPPKLSICNTCQTSFQGENKYCSSICLSIARKKKGPHSHLTKSTCKYCQFVFFARTRLYYCNTHRDEMPNKRAIYRFKFNIYDYPHLFDLELLNKVGFYAPGGKSGAWNPNGLSRDHKISITEAIKNKYDPYYITHPLNCELMPHTRNNKKKTGSSITFGELKLLVDKFDLDCSDN